MHTIDRNNLIIPPAERALFERCELGQFGRPDGVQLAWLALRHPSPKGAIVFSNGRVEGFIKYLALYQQLFDAGYSLYTLDHRGQGLSSRLKANPHIGYVGRFSDYVEDMHAFVRDIVLDDASLSNAALSKTPLSKTTVPLFMAGHSMGGAIATLYLKANPGLFRAACFSAPMYGIRLPLPAKVIRALAHGLDRLGRDYVLGGGNYNPPSFAANDLTKSEPRYQAYRALYQDNPQLQLGSPSNHWLVEAIDAAKASISAAQNSGIPLLILQASDDTVVDNRAQLQAVGGRCELEVIDGARHEIFIAQDEARNQAIAALLGFFDRHGAQS